MSKILFVNCNGSLVDEIVRILNLQDYMITEINKNNMRIDEEISIKCFNFLFVYLENYLESFVDYIKEICFDNLLPVFFVKPKELLLPNGLNHYLLSNLNMPIDEVILKMSYSFYLDKNIYVESLRNKDELFKSIRSNLLEGLLILEDKKIVFSNSKAENILGISSKGIFNKEWNEVFVFKDEFGNVFKLDGFNSLNYDENVAKPFEFLVKYKDKDLLLKIEMVKGSSNHIIMMFEDISFKIIMEMEKKQMTNKIQNMINELAETNQELFNTQKNLIESERKNMLLTMTSTANHEISRPLILLQGNIEMLALKHNDQESKKYIDKANKAIVGIKKILTKFLEIEEPEVVKINST